VVLNAMDARALGAPIRTRTRCIAVQRHASHWLADLRDEITGNVYKVRARALVNAPGPWVEQVLNLDTARLSDNRVRLVKGSHIVVPRLFDHAYPYIFQNADGRVLFAIPFERDFTLLGLPFTHKYQQNNITHHPPVSIRYSYTETRCNPAIAIDAPGVDLFSDPDSPLLKRPAVLPHPVV